MSDYQTIKQQVRDGESPAIDAINLAICEQLGVVAGLAASLSKHAARLMAAQEHPWPIAPDQKGRVERRADALSHEHSRLTRLYYWRALAENAYTTAPANSG